jgi:hypothetical protein
MYFGDFKYIQECLHQGLIQWDGIARNVEYLGLSADIKIFLGNWYHAWLNPDRESEMCSDDDSDTVFTDSDDEDYVTETELEDIIETDNEKGLRGRVAGARPISFQSFQSLEFPSV